MIECSFCKKTFEADEEICPHCGVKSSDVEKCGNCFENVWRESDYCSNCGILRIEPEMLDCDNHPGEPAEAVCIVCGKPVCSNCRKIRMNKTFCDEDKHVRTYQNWGVAYISSTEYEAEMIKANLENAGIETMILNQQDHAYFLTVGPLARVNVMVPSNCVNEAKEIIEKLKDESDNDE